MKTPQCTMVLVLLLAAAAFTTSRADDDPYADFRIPTHSWTSWGLNGGANGHSSLQNLPGVESHQSTISGILSTLLNRGYDSDRARDSDRYARSSTRTCTTTAITRT